MTPVNYYLRLLLLNLQKKEDDYFLVTLIINYYKYRIF